MGKAASNLLNSNLGVKAKNPNRETPKLLLLLMFNSPVVFRKKKFLNRLSISKTIDVGNAALNSFTEVNSSPNLEVISSSKPSRLDNSVVL
jgi:hypothetical protein